MLQNPPDPNEPRPVSNRKETMYGATLPFHILAWIAVFVRLWTRYKVVRNPGWDDYIIIVCSVFNLVSMVGFIGGMLRLVHIHCLPGTNGNDSHLHRSRRAHSIRWAGQISDPDEVSLHKPSRILHVRRLSQNIIALPISTNVQVGRSSQDMYWLIGLYEHMDFVLEYARMVSVFSSLGILEPTTIASTKMYVPLKTALLNFTNMSPRLGNRFCEQERCFDLPVQLRCKQHGSGHHYFRRSNGGLSETRDKQETDHRPWGTLHPWFGVCVAQPFGAQRFTDNLAASYSCRYSACGSLPHIKSMIHKPWYVTFPICTTCEQMADFISQL
jgi:hypothetical protein